MPAAFLCSLIKVTARTAGPRCCRSSVESRAVFALEVGMGTFPEVLRGHAGSGDSSGLLPFLACPSTPFPLSGSIQAAQILAKSIGPARARHLLQPPTVSAGGEAASPRAFRASGWAQASLGCSFLPPSRLLPSGTLCLSQPSCGSPCARCPCAPGCAGSGGHTSSRQDSKSSAALRLKIEPGALSFLQ